MRALIIRGTTLRGEPLDEGTVVDLDDATFHLLKSQGQAVQCTPELLKEASRLNAQVADTAADEGAEDPRPRKARATATEPK